MLSCTCGEGESIEMKDSLRACIVVAGSVMMGALLLASCGPSSTASNQEKQKASLGSNIAMANAALSHSPDGSADLTWDASNQKLVVKLQVIGLTPKSVHPVYIHAGTCRQPGAIKYALVSLVANVAGIASSTSSVEHVAGGLAQADWSIAIHNGASGQPGTQSLIISCADVQSGGGKVQGGQGTQVMHVLLGAASGPNQQANGVAQLRLVDKGLTVSVTMTGLVPRSTHVASIHTGSCETQGGIIYTLKPINADAQGNGSSVTLLSGVEQLPAHGWYINVRLAGNAVAQTGSQPIACGNVQTAG